MSVLLSLTCPLFNSTCLLCKVAIHILQMQCQREKKNNFYYSKPFFSTSVSNSFNHFGPFWCLARFGYSWLRHRKLKCVGKAKRIIITLQELSYPGNGPSSFAWLAFSLECSSPTGLKLGLLLSQMGFFFVSQFPAYFSILGFLNYAADVWEYCLLFITFVGVPR